MAFIIVQKIFPHLIFWLMSKGIFFFGTVYSTDLGKKSIVSHIIQREHRKKTSCPSLIVKWVFKNKIKGFNSCNDFLHRRVSSQATCVKAICQKMADKTSHLRYVHQNICLLLRFFFFFFYLQMVRWSMILKIYNSRFRWNRLERTLGLPLSGRQHKPLPPPFS